MTERIAKEEKTAASPPIELSDLREVSQLQELFSQDGGSTRLLLLLSPT